MAPQITLSGFATALFSSWYFCHEMGILFDCGDGASSHLLQKSRKINHVFISHADRDHLCGLMQFCQLNGREGLNIYYPKDCGTFPNLEDFLSKFDPHVASSRWIPLDIDSEIVIRKDLIVRVIQNRHVDLSRGVKSLSFVVERVSKKLKPEMSGKSGSELAAIRSEMGEQAISNTQRSPLLVYSGDTPVEFDGRYNDTEILIHEATFLVEDELDDNPIRNKHSSLDRVIEMVAKTKVQHLILGHFSSRFSDSEIDSAIRYEVKKYPSFPAQVYRVHPSKMYRNIFSDSILEVE